MGEKTWSKSEKYPYFILGVPSMARPLIWKMDICHTWDPCTKYSKEIKHEAIRIDENGAKSWYDVSRVAWYCTTCFRDGYIVNRVVLLEATRYLNATGLIYNKKSFLDVIRLDSIQNDILANWNLLKYPYSIQFCLIYQMIFEQSTKKIIMRKMSSKWLILW